MTTATAPLRIDDHLLDGLHRLGGYTCVMDVSAERQYENLLDWEHLPYLHPTSFAWIELVERDRWWWRAKVGRPSGSSDDAQVIVLCIDPGTAQWAIRVESGRNLGQLIHIRLKELAPRRIELDVAFYSPHRPRNDVMREAMYHYYHSQFWRLYDEDGAAMAHRQEVLDRTKARTTNIVDGQDLGRTEDVLRRVPLQLLWRGTSYWVTARDGVFHVSAADCPHMFGPLPAPATDAPEVVCPWHGYRFDATKHCSADGRQLRLRRPFALTIEDDRVRVQLSAADRQGSTNSEPRRRS